MASTYLSLHVHIVSATAGRAPMIIDSWRADLHAYLAGCVRGLGAAPVAVGGVSDHVHLLVGLRATHAVADLVREVKKASNAWTSERYERFAWQAGYAALAVSSTHVPGVSAYVRSQVKHHRKVTSSDELRALLAEHGIDYGERFFE